MMASRLSLGGLVRPDGIGPVWYDDREILRRIFVTVRDRHWREIAPTHWESEVDERHHTATLTARHTSDSINFEWKGTLHVSENLQHLKFQMTGRALQDMEVCRLGLVVLHPVESMVGSQLVAVGPQGSQSLRVERTIAPQPIVDGIPGAVTEPFFSVVVQRSDFGRLELQFEGDLFEIEDQRNWGDASFKTYCTPLRLGFPRTLQAGTWIAQTLEMRFVPGVQTHRVTGHKRSLATQAGVFPRIGRNWAPSSTSNVAWHHIHFDLQAPEGLERLQEFLTFAPPTKVQIGVDTGSDGPSQGMLTLLSNHREQISRLILYGSRTALPPASSVERWRQRLRAEDACLNVPLLIGTRGYFVEFNREVPLGATGTGIAFPLTATVHSDDAETIRDNATAIRDMADAARNSLGASEVAVTPLALHHPRLVVPGKFPGELIAPWLAATLINAAIARVDSVTLSEDTIEALDAREPHASTLLSRLVACGKHEVMSLSNALPAGVHAAVFKASASERESILVANLTSKTTAVSLSNNGVIQLTRVTNGLTEESVECNAPTSIDAPGFSVTWIA